MNPSSVQGAHKHSTKVLFAPSPFPAGVDPIPPDMRQLVDSSSILAARPDLRIRSFAGQIALDEYAHYVNQTYLFEVLGFQIVSDLAVRAYSLSQFHAFTAQAFDEARHVQLYHEMLRNLPHAPSMSASIPRLYENIVLANGYIEKVIKGLVVLEGLAVGMFAARCQCFPGALTTALDQVILREEFNHMGEASRIISESLHANLLTRKDLFDILREGIQELTADILPLSVAAKHGISIDKREMEKLKVSGIVGKQSAITRSCYRSSLKTFFRDSAAVDGSLSWMQTATMH